MRADPAEAVFAGADGLDVIPAVLARAADLLRPGGVLAVEHDDTHGDVGRRAAARASGALAPIAGHPRPAGRSRYATAVRATAEPVAPARGGAGWPPWPCSTTAPTRRSGTTAIATAAHSVASGQLVVLPTDTVYGLGADAFDAVAVADLLRAKGRGRDMPVPVLVGSWSTIDGLVSASPRARGTWSRRSGRAG